MAMTERARIRLFGGFEAEGPAGAAVVLPSRKAQALLARLALEPRRRRSRDELAALLWGEMSDERARHNLRQALSKIRHAFGGLAPIAGDDMLGFDASVCDVDVHELEGLLAEGDGPALKRALELYRGELLQGFVTHEDAFDDWAARERVRLRERTCRALARLSERLADEHHPEEAIALVQRRLELDPACEEAHYRLMQLLAAAGRRSEALRQYERCAEALAREFGAEPGAATRELCKRLRSAPKAEPTAPTAKGVADSALPDHPALAVLPFDNLGGDDERYFSDGIAEDVTTALSRFGSLLVIARASSFAYRERTPDLERIVGELGVHFVVQGSVRRSGERVRVSVQLLDAAKKNHVWAHRYDRNLQDLFAVQDEITETIVSTVAGRVEAARLNRARRMPPERLAAYDLLLRGKDHHHRYTPEDCKAAINMFQRALELDPEYAVAYAWLGCAYGQALAFFPGERKAWVERAYQAVTRAHALDEDDSECHRILAQVHLIRHQLEHALPHQQRALTLNPNDDRIVCAQGELCVYLGRAVEAETWVRKAMRLNPYHPESYFAHLGRALYHQQRYAEARAAFAAITRPRPVDSAYHAAACWRAGERDAARQLLGELNTRRPAFDAEAFGRSLPYAQPGDRAAVVDALRELAAEAYA